MPRIKPLNKLVNKARDLRDTHKERHRPSGFGFALADSIDYLDARHWQTVTAASSLFLSPDYLRVLENAGPDNLRQRYALIFRGRLPVAAVAAQSVAISLSRVRQKPMKGRAAVPLEKLQEKMLVCGNLLSWGLHGIAFAPKEDQNALWPAIAEALYRLRRADKLSGDTDLVMVKDIPDSHAAGAAALSRFSYRQLETEPNMILDISPKWRTYEDYLASLTSRYRKHAKEVDKDVAAAGFQLELLGGANDIARHADELHQLYLQTHRNARLRLVTLSPAFLPTLAATLGDGMRCTIVKRDNQLFGFVTTIRDGEQAIGYYIGFDRETNATVPIYFRLLQTVVDDALKLGCKSLSLGRTALEPKARLGARPDPLRLWIRHRLPMLNVLVRALLHTISHHDEPPERNPFKESKGGS
ncbi:MAG TPA: GNAT family N-acetyltransferase [Pyrinomonadaceae bacterium]|nr:GNAT family N-acetyltransferase [Pyrinomonadaceae bacterium]